MVIKKFMFVSLHFVIVLIILDVNSLLPDVVGCHFCYCLVDDGNDKNYYYDLFGPSDFGS